jgi:hypothetical protein
MVLMMTILNLYRIRRYGSSGVAWGRRGVRRNRGWGANDIKGKLPPERGSDGIVTGGFCLCHSAVRKVDMAIW